MADFPLSLQKQLEASFPSVSQWLRESGAKRILLGEPPLRESIDAKVRLEKMKPLPDPAATGYLQSKHWPARALNSTEFPTLLFVVEGEAHFRLGVTRKMVKRKPELAAAAGIYTLEINAPACLLLPAGVPYSDATRPHWERTDKALADSRLLWMDIRPEAATCHLCSTRAGNHEPTNAFLIPDQQLFLLANVLHEELAGQQPFHEETCAGLLQTMILRAMRATQKPEIIAANIDTAANLEEAGGLPHGARSPKSSALVATSKSVWVTRFLPPKSPPTLLFRPPNSNDCSATNSTLQSCATSKPNACKPPRFI